MSIQKGISFVTHMSCFEGKDVIIEKKIVLVTGKMFFRTKGNAEATVTNQTDRAGNTLLTDSCRHFEWSWNPQFWLLLLAPCDKELVNTNPNAQNQL